MSDGETTGPGGTLAPLVDHTALVPETTRADVDRLCREAIRHGFAAVCVNPCYVARAARELSGSEVAAATVVGFPLGAHDATAKVREAGQALEEGAEELDMVARIGAVREARWDVLADEVAAVVEVAGHRARVKVILETATLAPREILKAGRVAAGAGAHYLKTSTGFHPAGGATPEAVALLRMAAGPDVGVKAAGGVRDHDDALAMVAAGASRIGTSRGLDLVGCSRPLPDPLHVFLER
ncbi:MAG: deoxyribose-phosphate aldolase [Gemmatimonadota bacterium]